MIPLRIKVFETLRVLVENAGRLVTKQEFFDTAWPDTRSKKQPESHVSVLRKALGERATGQEYSRPCRARAIASPRRSSWRSRDRVRGDPDSPLRARQEIRYCTTS